MVTGGRRLPPVMLPLRIVASLPYWVTLRSRDRLVPALLV